MAYSSPATVAAGNVAPASWGNSVKAATDYLANPPTCRAFHSTTQSIASNSNTVLSFNSERFDTDSMHDTITFNSRITIKTAGVYVVTAMGAFAAAADYTAIGIHLRVNGSVFIGVQFIGTVADATFAYPIQVTSTWKFAVNDYVEALMIQKNSAAAARNTVAASSYVPEFSAAWVGLG